jgi:hypothetical protein
MLFTVLVSSDVLSAVLAICTANLDKLKWPRGNLPMLPKYLFVVQIVIFADLCAVPMSHGDIFAAKQGQIVIFADLCAVPMSDKGIFAAKRWSNRDFR